MYPPHTRRKLALATAALLTGLLPARTRAATTLTWDANLAQPGAQGGPGTWANAAGGWFNGTSNVTWNNANADSALFAGTAAGTVTISGTAVAQFLTFNTPGYTLTGGSLKLGNGSGGVNAGIHANADVTINSDIRPGGSFADEWLKDGAGTLTLGGLDHFYAAPLHIRSGAVAFANKGHPPSTIYFDGDATSRLTFTSPYQEDVGVRLNVNTTGTFDVPSPAGDVHLVDQLTGPGLLIKAGAGTFSPHYPTTLFTGSVRVDAGTFELNSPTVINARPVSLIGGTLSLQNNNPINFASDVTARPGTGNTATLAVGGASNTASAHTLPTLNVISGTLSVTSANNWGLTVNSVTNNAAIDLNNTRLTITSSLTFSVGNLPGTIRFAHDPTGAPAGTNRGLLLANDNPLTLSGTFAGQTGDADLLLAATRSSIFLAGSWRGGGAGATSTLADTGGGAVIFDSILHFNNLTADRTAFRPVRFWGNQPRNTQVEFFAGFVADHTNGGATDDGLGEVELSNVGWTTHSAFGLPIVTRQNPAGAPAGTHRAGLITFDNFSNPTSVGIARWWVQSNNQSYAGGVLVKQNGWIYLDANLTLSGRVNPYADNAVQIAANRTLDVTLDGPNHSLTFSGDLGFAPGSRINGNDALLVFNTDPGAGWYAGNYARNPTAGTVTSPAAPAHTLYLTVGNTVAGGAFFNAPVTRLDQLALSGTARVSLGNPGAPQKVLSVATRFVATQPQYALDLTNNAAILRASPYHTPDTVRSMLTRGDIRSTAADVDHALGYARAADVLPASGTSYSFLGLPVAADDVLIRYTLLGDATLDARVNFDDLLALAKNYNTTAAQWSSGDFNYDDSINFDDLLILAKHYNTSLPTAPIPGATAQFTADLAAAFAQVPEPSAALLSLTACGFALSARRRRRWTPR